MFLYDSFLSLNASEMTTSFQDSMIQRSDLIFATKKAVASYRSFGDPVKTVEYKRFLATCEHALTNVEDAPLLQVMINYLADSEHATSNDLAACEKITRLLVLNLQNQSDVLGIISMGRVVIDRPYLFAAFLRFMLLRGVTPEEILSSYLLQDFFRYHSWNLNQANNPIEQLYCMLRACPETAILSTLAKTVSCKEGGLSSYALDGSSQHEAGVLKVIEYQAAPLRFTPEEKNLNALHVVFGVNFLMGALHQWEEQKSNEIWINTVIQLFNQVGTVNQQLPDVLNRLHENMLLLPVLSKILHDETLTFLVEKHVVGVFHLIPYRPILINALKTKDLSLYLQTLRHQSSSELALISSLFALLNGVKELSPVVSLPVFDALLDAILAESSALDDAVMIGKLRKLSGAYNSVTRKAESLQKGLDTVIQIQTEGVLKDMDYIAIEDVWRDAALKIQHLQTIFLFKTSFPLDKYKLYSRIASLLLKQNNGVLNLDDYSLSLGVEPVFSADNITSYERLIIELLASIDDDHLRAACIQRLDEKVQRPWRTFPYGDCCLLTQAVEAGNLGLVRWLYIERIKHKGSCDTLAITAAEASQWHVAAWFHERYPLKQNIVNQLLHMAVSQGYVSGITSLLSNNNRCMPTLRAIELAFKLAAKRNDAEAVSCFINGPQHPCDSVVASTFKMAIQLKYFDLSRVIANGFSGGLLSAAIAQTLKDAARQNRCDVLNMLVTLSTNFPDQSVIESALMGATRSNKLQSVKWLVNCSIVPPRIPSIQRAKKEAHKLEFAEIEHFLFILCPQAYKRRASCLIEPLAKNMGGDLVVSKPDQVKRAMSSSAVSNMQSLHQHGFFKEASKFSSMGNFSQAFSPGK